VLQLFVLSFASCQGYVAVTLNLGLIKINGFEGLKRMRGHKIMAPAFILTARDDLDDRVKALDLSTNDYKTKSIKLPELGARQCSAYPFVIS
jgi:DNA-binding response OmpR family regulator